jgi:hypothetical protein
MEEEHNGSEAHSDFGPLSQRQAENIANLAVRLAQERMYAEIGRSVVKKILWLLGAASAGAYLYFNGVPPHFGGK